MFNVSKNKRKRYAWDTLEQIKDAIPCTCVLLVAVTVLGAVISNYFNRLKPSKTVVCLPWFIIVYLYISSDAVYFDCLSQALVDLPC